MKKQVISMVCLGALAFASCTNDDSVKNESKVAVQLSTSVITRASVDGTAFADGTEIGVFAAQGASVGAIPAWAASANFIQNDKATVSSSIINTSATYWYPIGGEEVKVVAYYPYSANVTCVDATAPVVNYTITGQEDLLAGTTAVATLNKTTATTAANSKITFNHLLTQLKFSAVSGATASGMTITKIVVKGKSTVAVSLGDVMSATASGATADFTAPILNGGAVSSTVAEVGGAVMAEPGLASFDIVVTLGTVDFPISVTPTAPATAFEVGKSYNVVLTVNKSGVSATAVITEWVDGGQGSGTIG